MKKLVALFSILSSACAFAAHNEFTFDVNSSGANMYVCGFELDTYGSYRTKVHQENYVFNNQSVSGSYVTWTEELVDEWSGKVLKVTEHNSNVDLKDITEPLEVKVTPNADIANWRKGCFTRIKNLKFFLSDEYFGDEMRVNVCYQVPLYLDLKKVDFDINNQIEFTNKTTEGRDYLFKSAMSSKVTAAAMRVFDDAKLGADMGAGEASFNDVDISQGNATTGSLIRYSDATADYNGDSDSFITDLIFVNYIFTEEATTLRPHVAHGGQFTLNTDVVPVHR